MTLTAFNVTVNRGLFRLILTPADQGCIDGALDKAPKRT
jgi:hypothetical protein